MIGKVKGQVIAEIEGLTITADLKRAKKAGKNRLVIQIRQNGKPKKWRVFYSLAWAQAVDVQFVEEPN